VDLGAGPANKANETGQVRAGCDSRPKPAHQRMHH
jgi:hypothetical protein